MGEKPSQRSRLIGPSGEVTIRRLGYQRHAWTDLYHWLLRIPWIWLVLVILGFFFALNALFALAYLAGGAVIENAAPGSFWDAFFFSAQTVATLGYGKMAPLGFYANMLSSFEVFVGLLGLAVVTGLVFAKFSRPTARVLFSRRAVVSTHNGVPSLMFRMVNARTNKIIEADLHLALLRDESIAEGNLMRRFHDLRLLRNHTPVFGLSWLAIHPIDEASPLRGLSHEDLENIRAEFVASFSGIDDTFLQPVHKQHSYLPEEIAWNSVFEDILVELPEGGRAIDYARFHDIRRLPEPKKPV